MRLTKGFAVLGLVALAGCASQPSTTAPAANVAANGQQAEAAVVKPKYCQTGSKICTSEQQSGINVGSMSGDALRDAIRGHVVSGQGPQP